MLYTSSIVHENKYKCASVGGIPLNINYKLLCDTHTSLQTEVMVTDLMFVSEDSKTLL